MIDFFNAGTIKLLIGNKRCGNRTASTHVVQVKKRVNVMPLRQHHRVGLMVHLDAKQKIGWPKILHAKFSIYLQFKERDI
jgi:hypothetical protein